MKEWMNERTSMGQMARNLSRAFAGLNGSITEICSGIYYFQFPLQLLILQASSFVWWNEPRWTVDLKFAAKCRHFYELRLTVLSCSAEDKPWGSTPTTFKVQYIRLEFCLAYLKVLRNTCSVTQYIAVASDRILMALRQEIFRLAHRKWQTGELMERAKLCLVRC